MKKNFFCDKCFTEFEEMPSNSICPKCKHDVINKRTTEEDEDGGPFDDELIDLFGGDNYNPN